MKEITYEMALEKAKQNAENYGKIIVVIEENNEYWNFIAGNKDGIVTYDNGAGSIFISKKDGSERFESFPFSEFYDSFEKTAKKIYDYYEENAIAPHNAI